MEGSAGMDILETDVLIIGGGFAAAGRRCARPT